MSAVDSDIERFEKDLGSLARIGALLTAQERPEEAWRAVLLEVLNRLEASAAAIVLRLPPRFDMSLRATAYSPGLAPFSWQSCIAPLFGPRGLIDGSVGPRALSGFQIGASMGDHWLLCAALPGQSNAVGGLFVVLSDPDPQALPRMRRLLEVVASMLACDRAGWQRAVPTPNPTPAPAFPGRLPVARQDTEHVQPKTPHPWSEQQDLKAQVEQLEKEAIGAALSSTGGNVAAAARLLGATARIVRYKIKKLGIEGPPTDEMTSGL